MNRSEKKFALVTGGSSGIGYELAKKLAANGYNLVLVSRNEIDLAQVAAELSEEHAVDVIPIPKDLFDVDNAFQLYDEIKMQGIEIDVLVNDAGQGHYGKFADTDIRKELAIINLNICSLVVLTKLFLKDMIARQHGKILNLSSIASKTPGPWHSVYHATKAFVQSFTEAIRSELKDTSITVTALLPGATATDFFNKANMNESKIVVDGDLADPADVAEDGFKALMEGDDMVISGFKNKLQVAQSNLVSDATAADKMKEAQEPADADKKNF